MTESAIDLPAYFARIGYDGPRDPTLATLRAVLFRHVCTIPFENLDILLGRRIAIDFPSVERKLVRDRRGGYCFEQNLLLCTALRALGFQVMTIAGRIRLGRLPDEPAGLTHMLLIVELDGRRYVADAGIGSWSLSAPLLLDTEEEQATPHEPRRLLHQAGYYLQQVKLGAEWSDVVRFNLEPQHPIDYELGNWFTCTHAQSRFMQNLAVSRSAEGRRYTLLNREFTIRQSDGRAEKRDLGTPDELLVVLAEHFGLHFSPGTRFDAPGVSWPS
ncbi:MAG: arylamine N-acetyltransferase [Verrucomicrobia bacterium]|nr:arylamine N-acetyltransferase [Verrucomicrobiota bacterium]